MAEADPSAVEREGDKLKGFKGACLKTKFKPRPESGLDYPICAGLA